MTSTLNALVTWGTIAATALALSGCGADDPGALEDDGGGATTGGDTQSCQASQASGVSGNKITVNVSWPGTLGVEAGSGQLIIWTMADLTFDGTDVTGQVQPCGSYVPPIQTKAAVGGLKVQPLIADSVWDSGMVPTTEARGTISGSGVGATIKMEPAGAATGLSMNDPINDSWPDSWTDLYATDTDGDGFVGIAAYPNLDSGFSPPPLDIFPDGAKAELLSLATRTVIELQGKRDSCTTASGTAIVHAFDNHIVACKVEGGGDCTPEQVTFVDNNRTIYEIDSASYEMVQVGEGASCADVRAALPR